MPTPEEQLARRLSAIAGLDAAHGLQHLPGRGETYLRLLRNFAQTRAGDIEGMQAHLEAGDVAAFAAMVHNVKGVSGYLGALTIASICQDIAVALRNGADQSTLASLAESLAAAQRELAAGVLALRD